MKKLGLIIVSLVIYSTVCLAQNYTDVVYLKNGSIVRGIIIEQTPNESLKIKTSGGSVFVYKMDEVDRMTKEESVEVNETTNSNYNNYDFGVIMLAWLDGTVHIEGGEFDKQSNLVLHTFLDYFMVEKFACGVYINKSLNSAMEDETGIKDNMFEIGMALKPRFFLSDKFVLKPGLNLGYRIHNSPEFSDSEKVKGFGLNFTLEGQYAISEKGRFTAEFGFLSQPVGGNDFADVSYAPILMIGAGYVHSF